MPSPIPTSACDRSAAGREPRGEAGEKDKPNQHERTSPRLPMPVVVRGDGVGIDLERERGDRLVEPLVPEPVAERREQQRRGLTCDPCDRDHDAGQDTGAGCGQDNPQRHTPLGYPQAEPGLTKRIRDEPDHLLRRAQYDRHHDHAERKAAGERRESTHRQDDQRVGEDAEDDRRNAVQHVRDEAHKPRQASIARLGQIHTAQDAHWDAQAHRKGDHDEAADDRIGDPATGFSDRLRQMHEEVDVDRRGALVEEKAEDQEQRKHDEERGQQRQRAHTRVDQPPEPYRHQSRAPRAGPPTLHTRRRAIALTTIVTSRRSKPISTSAETYRSDVASVNSLAMTLAMVYPGANSDAATSGRLPITIVTAMVSPRARPSPSRMAPMRPDRP